MKAVALVAVLAGLLVSQSAVGQDGCKAATQSCSQMNKTCESRCQAAANNAARCIAICTSTQETCRSTGVWKTGMSAGCWRTNNRS
ncbi:hypothetical protein DWF00_11010 [Bosea caraganae]|uniref:Uncharacterized protein n=1 Tax=Bosea caraganae TaxID=2763117 RepID=A0A370LCB0_9HYPH|nr:hypothetical protein [Bosea caraganae]RDJ27474.1 hypothetical protein DWF00_11010 [Bosea caraganae]RDJ29489.1 hypothetical protein DWE98_02780 [Bosea caraganae]